MPRLIPHQIACSICGHLSEQHILLSTSMSASPDLDFRPGPFHRFTMPHWLQVCPHCGYCAVDLTQQLPPRLQWSPGLRPFSAYVPESVAAIVGSQRYHQQRTSHHYPELANHFLCWAHIQARRGYRAQAGQSTLCAAWVCDDATLAPQARQCRSKAADLLMTAYLFREQEELATETRLVVLVDVLRRSGRRIRAQLWCRMAHAHQRSALTQALVEQQRILLKHHDRACHTMEEMLGPREYQRLTQPTRDRPQ